MQCNFFFKAAAWKAWLPLLALIICSTISAAPRACSLACWYRIFCFSISFSWQAKWQVQSTRRIWLLANMLQFPLGDGVPQRSFLYPLLLPLPRLLRSSTDTGGKVSKIFICEILFFPNLIIASEGTFAIMSAYAIYNGSSSRWLKRRKFQVIIIYYERVLNNTENLQAFHPPCSVMWLSPPLCQSVVTEVKYELVEGVRLDLSHLLFLLFHDLHGGFLQGATRCRQLASIRHSPDAFCQACESLSSASTHYVVWFFYVSSFLNFLYLCKLPYGQICLYTFCREK